MHIRQLFREIGTPLRRAVRVLIPRFQEIETSWRARMGFVGIDTETCEALLPLTVEAQQENLANGKFEDYRNELENVGQTLERNGVSEADVAVAIGFYLESCLPHLLNEPKKPTELALALTRLSAATQFLTLSSSANERAANWRRLQERERLGISRDLHDDIGHNLLVLKLYLEIMEADLGRGDLTQLHSKLQEALALVATAVDSVRRLMLDLGPAMVAQFGFLPALKIYARQFTLRTETQVQVEDANLPEDLPSSYQTTLYRVLQGALSNIVKHSGAKHVMVRIGSVKRAVLVMSIEDDGAGFEIAKTPRQSAFGLTAMRERIEMLGGKFHLESWPAGQGKRKHGTRIEVDLPLHGIVLEKQGV